MPVVGNFATRYRVRNASKGWSDKGPDLLRVRGSARRQLVNILFDLDGPFYVRVGDKPWVKVGPRAEVMERFARWSGELFRVGLENDDEVEAVAYCKREKVPILPLPNCSPDTVLYHSLIQYQFGAIHSGGYLYRRVKDSSSWSDHAWGTADDTSHDPPRVSNDKLTDWVARMAASNNVRFDYALGSKGGKVMYVDGDDGSMRPSTAADSHTWHVHASVRDHDGRKPPREGGVW